MKRAKLLLCCKMIIKDPPRYAQVSPPPFHICLEALFHWFQKVFERRSMRTIAVGVTIPVSASPSFSFGATPGISFQCAVGTGILVVTAPTSIEKALSINFMRYYATHIGKVGPAIASSIACFEICLNKVSLNNQLSIIYWF